MSAEKYHDTACFTSSEDLADIHQHRQRDMSAMHLLQSNVDLNMIRSWLDHASIETTHGYVEIDLEMKRKTP